MGGARLLNDVKSLRETRSSMKFAERRSACPRRIDSGYGTPGSCAGFDSSGLWKREYVRCIFASSAARPTAGAAAIRARSFVPLLLPLLTPMDVGRVMACAQDGVPRMEPITSWGPLLF